MSLHKFQLIIEASILVMGTLFPIANPIGSAAQLMAMVDGLNRKGLALMAKKIAIYSFFHLFLSMLLGTKLLSFFGISLYSVQIGGGLVVMIIGWQLLAKVIFVGLPLCSERKMSLTALFTRSRCQSPLDPAQFRLLWRWERTSQSNWAQPPSFRLKY